MIDAKRGHPRKGTPLVKKGAVEPGVAVGVVSRLCRRCKVDPFV
jgi:hypothetical protein